MPAGALKFQPMALPRLIFVTGKGGTGKSTVATALATALSRTRPTTIADLDQRLTAARMLGADPKDNKPVAVNDSLEVTALTPRAELESFIHRIVPVRAISRRMLKSRTFGYVTAALPGLEAFLMLERLRLMAGRAALEDRFAVIDGPATGHALELLSVAQGIGSLAPGGRLNRLAGSVQEFLSDNNRFGVLLTVTPEELSLREALEAAATLREKLGLALIAAVLNCVAPALFTPSELVRLGPFEGHHRLAGQRRAAADLTQRARRELQRARIETIELPMLFEATLGPGQIDILSRRLETDLLTP